MDALTREQPGRGAFWLSWRAALLVIVGVTAIRAAHSIWLSPWDLVGDEAYYWQQSRHLALCYNEKGPLLPWLIAGACRVFGDVEWAVRLPVLLAFGIGAWGAGRLGVLASRDERVGALAAYLFLLMPVFEANAQFSTQDGVIIPLWVALTACGLVLVRRWRAGQGVCGGWGLWMLMWGLLGVGMLLKQSVVTFLPGAAIFWLIHRRELRLRPAFLLQQATGLTVFAAFCSPLVIWNAQHGWPMLAHTIGHLSGAGDQAGKILKGNPISWEGSVLGGLFAAFGPALLIMSWATVAAWRRRRDSQEDWFTQSWLVLCAWFSTFFYVALALTKPVIASWPLPSMVPLVVLAAQALLPVLTRQSPGVHLRRLWWATAVYGVVGTVLVAFPNAMLLIPGARSVIQKRMLGRLGGGREQGRRLAAVVSEAQAKGAPPPLIVAPSYSMAALTTFYVPGHPGVASRDGHLTHRPSALDGWPETSLEDPSNVGRTLILMQDRRNDPDWKAVLLVDDVRPSSDPACLIAINYRGFRTEALAAGGGR